MSDDKWKVLEPWLVKDYWTPDEACHIFAGLLKTEVHGSYSNSEIEKSNNRHRSGYDERKIKKAKRDEILSIWNRTAHSDKVKEKEAFHDAYDEFYKVAYCIRWAKDKRIPIPWFDWAVEQELIDPLDVTEGYSSHGVTDNGNTGANRMPENNAMGAKKEENLLRLIYIFKDMLLDKSIKKHLPFTDQEAIAEYIHNNFNEQFPVKRLSAKGVQATLADANKVKSKDNHTD